MRVAIAGAGAVGRAIAQALLADGHTVLLIERRRERYRPNLVPEADWMLADACESESLRAAGIDGCDVVMAATGDDKANLVFALLAKTEFHVRRVLARVNQSENQWLFGPDWGVDVAVSTPSTVVAAVEEAVTVGEIVRLMTLRRGVGNLLTVTLAADASAVGRAAGELELPAAALLLTIVRDGAVVTPSLDTRLAAGDELVLAVRAGAGVAAEERVREVLTGRVVPR